MKIRVFLISLAISITCYTGLKAYKFTTCKTLKQEQETRGDAILQKFYNDCMDKTDDKDVCGLELIKMILQTERFNDQVLKEHSCL